MLGSQFLLSSGMENYKKTINILVLALGMLIFCGVILLKVEVWAQRQEAEVRQTTQELQWEDFRYHQTVLEVIRQNKI